MSTQTKQIAAIYIEREKFTFVSSQQVQVFSFQPEAVKDLEVINKELLIAQIKSFIETNKLNPTVFIIILSGSILFEQDFGAPNQDVTAEMQKFLDNVPFENVISKTFPLANGVKVIAANKDLSKVIKHAFEMEGFIATAVVPSIAFGGSVDPSDQGMLKTIEEKIDGAKEFNMLTETEIVITTAKQQQTKEKKKNTLLVIAFVLLMMVAAFLVFYALSPQSKPKPQPAPIVR